MCAAIKGPAPILAARRAIESVDATTLRHRVAVCPSCVACGAVAGLERARLVGDGSEVGREGAAIARPSAAAEVRGQVGPTTAQGGGQTSLGGPTGLGTAMVGSVAVHGSLIAI